MNDVSFYLPIAKVDREQRTVFGYASTPTRDLDGEVIELDAIKAALPEYMEWRNIREMHQPSAVGVAKEANVDEKGLYIGAKIVDDDAWKKVTEEVYKGFSIGGDVTGRKGDTITGLNLIEISLVDRPANPDCKIDVIKAAGAEAPVARAPVVELERAEIGLIGRLLAKLSGVEKADKEPYGDVEYADPGYQSDKKKRYPIDTEEHIRAAWNYIHQGKNADKYSASEVASIKRRIIAAWKKKIDAKGPPEAKAAEPEEEKAAPAHESEAVDDRDDVPAGRDGFSRPAKAAFAEMTKSMSAAQTLSCVADMLECAERCLRMEGAEERGDPADCDLADRLCDMRCDVLDVISEKAQHEKREEELEAKDNEELGNDLSGADKMAEAVVAKRAASGRHADHLAKAASHIAAAMREHGKLDGGDAEKSAAVRKAARDAHERLGEHLVLAAHHIRAAGGERGEAPNEGDSGDFPRGEGRASDVYEPERGIEAKSQGELTEGNVPAYDADKPYPGKAAYSAPITGKEAEALMRKAEEAAYWRGKAEALEKQPGTPKARLFAVPRGAFPVAEADEPSATETLLRGVDLNATDAAGRQAATRKMLGNMIANSRTFARPVIGDPTFRGAAAR